MFGYHFDNFCKTQANYYYPIQSAYPPFISCFQNNEINFERFQRFFPISMENNSIIYPHQNKNKQITSVKIQEPYVEPEIQNISQRNSVNKENRCLKTKRRALIWSTQTDEKIKFLVQTIGYKWKKITTYIPDKSSKQIRERYLNQLRENINRAPWTQQEDTKLAKLVQTKGKKWKSFEDQLSGRTQCQIKSRYYGKLVFKNKTNNN